MPANTNKNAKIEKAFNVLCAVFPEEMDKAIEDEGLSFVPFELTVDDHISVIKKFLQNVGGRQDIRDATIDRLRKENGELKKAMEEMEFGDAMDYRMVKK